MKEWRNLSLSPGIDHEGKFENRFDDTIAYAFLLIDGVPNNYKDAIESLDRLHWQEVVNQEIASLEINQT